MMRVRRDPRSSLVLRLSSTATRHQPFLLALAFAALAAAPLFSNPGFLVTRGVGDTPNLLFRVHQLLAALRAGEFPARWMPDAALGYGLPYFTYYASLSTHVAALFKLYGFSYTLAIKLAQLTALLLAAAAVYLWAREAQATQARAWLASAAYTFAPFHLANLYVRGDSLAELWAMTLYPLGLWAAHRLVRQPGAGRAFMLAAITALLILTHNVSALNFLPFVVLYLAMACGEASGGRLRFRVRPFTFALLSVVWGLALAAFFWLPALLEIEYVQIGDLTQGFFFYGRHFRGLDLVQTSLFYNPEAETALSTPFSMSLVQAAATAAGLAALTWRAVRDRRWSWLDAYLLVGLALSTWMVTPLSAWLWDNLPLVRFTQFPWRFLSIQSLFAAMITAHLAPGAPPGSTGSTAARPWVHRLFAVLLGLALAVSSLGRLRLDFIPLRDSEVSTERLNLYEYFTGSLGNTVNNEYLPRWVTPRPFTSDVFLHRPPRLKALSGEAVGRREWKRGAAEQWSIQVVDGPAALAVPVHYWPGWAAEADGRRLAVRPAESLGWVAFDLEPGAHLVTLHLGRTPVRAAAELFSLLALVGPGAILLCRKVREERNALHAWSFRYPGIRSPFFFLLPVLLVGGSVLLRLFPAPAESALPLSMDYDQLAYLHRDAVRFEGGSRLLRVGYSADHLARGDTLTLHTEWQASGPSAVTVSLAPPSNLLAPVPIVLASTTVPLTPNSDLFLPIPADIPPGVYYVTVQLVDASGPRQALTASGRVRGPVHLAPIWVDDPGPASDESPISTLGPSIQLIAAAADDAAPGLLNLRLLWRALAGLPRNYHLALRVRDPAGHTWAEADAQTAYGFYPTHLWRPGEVVPDFYHLRLLPGAPPGDYALTLSLYDVVRAAAIGETTLNAHIATATPAGDRTPRYALAPDLALAGVEFPPQVTQGDAPTLSAGWLTLAAPRADYRARWTLEAPDGSRLSQTLDLAPNSSPTTWPAGAFVLGRARLALPNALAPGPYTLSVNLVDERDQPVGEAAVLGEVEVLARARTFAVPALHTAVGATFGDRLKLWGYDAERTDSRLRLTLVWGALAEPGADYKFFVHLFNPSDDFVVAQVDAMPRDFAYPTALWVAGEVVSDTVTLSLADVAPGAYRLAVGWYNPNTTALERLPAFDAQGQALAADRVVLPLVVDVP